jgi:predicted HTH transcriptional regulator
LSPNRHGHYTYQVLPYTGDANQRANGERDKVAQAIANLQQAKTKATTNQIFAMTGIRKPSIAAHLVALQGLGLARNMGTQTNGNWQLIDQTPDIDLGLDF